jgi:hypothetical protein
MQTSPLVKKVGFVPKSGIDYSDAISSGLDPVGSEPFIKGLGARPMPKALSLLMKYHRAP